MFEAQFTKKAFLAYFSKKFILAFLIAGISAISIAAYIGIRTTSPSPPPSFGCQPGWHEFIAGTDDNFALPTEPAFPSPGLQLFLTTQYPNTPYGRVFDESTTPDVENKILGHTFTGVAPDPTKENIAEATLEFRIRPTIENSQLAGIPATDFVSLYFMGNNGNQLASGWTRQIGLDIVYNVPGLVSGQWSIGRPAELIQLDLDALPNADGSTTNLLSSFNAAGFLDFFVHNDTTVDYAKLRVRHECIPPPPIRVPVDLESACTRDIWACTPWSACSAAGEQTRVCTLSADCPSVETPKPVEGQACTPLIRVPVDDRGPAVEACAESGQSCGPGTSCCQGLECTAAGICQTPPPPQKPTDLKAEKALQNSTFHYGGQGSFSILVENVGSKAAASPITLTDELPPGLTYLSFSDPYSSYWSCTASGQKITCVYNGTDISPGGFLPALIIKVRIATIDTFPAATGDQVENCATVEYPNDTNSANDRDCVTAIITPN